MESATEPGPARRPPAGPRARPSRARDPRVRGAVVEVRGRQGAGHPRAVRHVGHAVLPGAQRPDRQARGAGGRAAADQAPAPAAGQPAAHPLRRVASASSRGDHPAAVAGTRRSLTGHFPHPEVVVADPAQSGSRSPLRIGGVALLGVGVIAAFDRAGHHDPGQQQRHRRTDPDGVGGRAGAHGAGRAGDRTGRGEPAPGRRQGGAAPATPFVAGPTGDGTAVGAAPAPHRPRRPSPRPHPSSRHRLPWPLRLPRRHRAAPRPSPMGPCASTTTADHRAWPRGRLPTSAVAGWTVAEIGGYPRRDHPDEHRLLPPGHGRADCGAGDRPGVRAAGRAALRRDPVRQPRADRHRDQRRTGRRSRSLTHADVTVALGPAGGVGLQRQ